MAIITLSRWTFSGGRELGQKISENLGYRFVSRDDIISKTAGYGMSGERMERARRRRFGFLQRFDLEWSHYLIYARAALTKEIRQGSLVYLGSNGQALLRDFPNVLNVGVMADMEYRIDNLIKRTEYVVDRKKARKLIQEIDEKKARWSRTLHDDRLLDPGDFDLVIEPGQTTLADACDLIHATLEQPKYQTTYKSLEAIDLLTVAAELRARIAMKDDVIDDDVNVEIQDGVIVIGGSVHSAEDLEGIKELLD
ncbi:MAG: cytidylate kinase-like family protein [Chloroflexi bacterium]|nr:cytidylate kinase-like family protein [Chloroflexota bacterium]MCH8350599.1 cytidylate kinase-like family protein [Chloroflexota bacterium]MCI0780524.1 cytidylate kinase-like family protein [Chloroflexota bacterium]MCI0785612.1 cytidylate kinase-like family protein [Chloroflexota bacterium]MCI0793028.1 cytidylate kinase-like family protein [Chloroflexota bacterium]